MSVDEKNDIFEKLNLYV